jgi:hypothetical protein
MAHILTMTSPYQQCNNQAKRQLLAFTIDFTFHTTVS